MIPATLPLDETQRLAALRRYAVLDTPAEEALDELAALAATICETPMAMISLVDEYRQWFKAKVGLEAEETSREASFCAHALGQSELLIVPDATQDARFANFPTVTGAPGIRFYAGAPLVTPEGAVLGALCVIDRLPRVLTKGQEHALGVLSRQVMTQLDLRRQSRELEASDGKRRAIFEAEPECVKLLSADGTLHEMNAAGLRLIEADRLETVVGQCLLPVVVPEDREAVRAMLEAVARGERRSIEYRIVGLKGTTRWVEMNGAPFHDVATGQDHVLGVSHDITPRKLAEEKIQRLNRLYAVSSSINEAIVRIRNTQELYEQACRIAVERGGLVMAWVGLIEPGTKALRAAARWGRDEGYLESIQVTATPDQREGRGPAGEAFRTGLPACCNDIEADTGSFASRADALQRGYRSCAAFPLKFEGCPMGVLVVYGGQPDYFDREELHVLNALAENISFAIESVQREQQRRLAEQALRSSEGRYRTLFEYAPDGIIIANPESIYLDANASALRMFGYGRDEFIGLHAKDIVAEAELAHVAPALNVIQGGAAYHREWTFRRKDSSTFAAEVIATQMPDGNLLAMIRDVTERKRAEARFHRLVDSNAQGVMFWNAKGEITGANDAYLHIVGYSREDLEAGRITWEGVTPPEYRDLDLRAFEEIRATGVCAPFEKEYLRKDGSRVPVFGGAATFEDNPEEGFCFVLDLTERKKLEQQFLRAQRMESVGTLASGVAHDLNNILAPIMMSAPLLRRDLGAAQRERIISSIEASAERGAQIVKQVLAFGRGLGGVKRPLQIGVLIKELMKIMQETFPKNISIGSSVGPDLWPVVADGTQIHQVLLNLCVNARDAMPGGGTLRVSAANLDVDASYASMLAEATPGPHVLLEVSDTGCGMPPEVVERIFDPFFTTKGIGEGTGLGLSTVLGIVKSHGGLLNVNTQPGKGTTFQVYLPASPDHEAAPADVAGTPAPEGHGELLLVVDDEPDVRTVARLTLEAGGYRVLLAADGIEALALFAMNSGSVAAVLTDLMMPLLDGVALIRALRSMAPALPIVASTGLGEKAQLEALKAMGVETVLNKPYAADNLLRTMHRALHPKAALAG